MHVRRVYAWACVYACFGINLIGCMALRKLIDFLVRKVFLKTVLLEKLVEININTRFIAFYGLHYLLAFFTLIYLKAFQGLVKWKFNDNGSFFFFKCHMYLCIMNLFFLRKRKSYCEFT